MISTRDNTGVASHGKHTKGHRKCDSVYTYHDFPTGKNDGSYDPLHGSKSTIVLLLYVYCNENSCNPFCNNNSWFFFLRPLGGFGK